MIDGLITGLSMGAAAALFPITLTALEKPFKIGPDLPDRSLATHFVLCLLAFAVSADIYLLAVAATRTF